MSFNSLSQEIKQIRSSLNGIRRGVFWPSEDEGLNANLKKTTDRLDETVLNLERITEVLEKLDRKISKMENQ